MEDQSNMVDGGLVALLTKMGLLTCVGNKLYVLLISFLMRPHTVDCSCSNRTSSLGRRAQSLGGGGGFVETQALN